ncbi:MBOAT family O-acyltransferase, partial [candidate division CSSED10-310 bacterium]
MLFNSYTYWIFLPLVFSLYWLIGKRNIKIQNLFVLIASYIFYSWWDWKFLTLIFISSIADFCIGLKLKQAASAAARKWLVYSSLVINLGLLGFFKYYNFFIRELIDSFEMIGISLTPGSLNIILPVGISFYTFQTLSYTLDIYKGKMEPTRDVIAFFAFVSFFPQLVAGPIERAKALLPQFEKQREFNYEQAVDGMRQIAWGLFKKIVIADTCAIHADYIFSNYATMNGSALLLGALYFAFQIYGDFSGYSDIAIGSAKLMGFTLMRNFALPYFSRDIAEFWQRWHISLSTWFRDFVYIPLGGSRCSKAKQIRNVLVTFTLSGLWHGANWTFIFWGLLNGLYYIPLLLFDRSRKHKTIIAEHRFFPSLKEACQVFTTFLLTTVTWVFFRAENLQQAFHY